MALNYYPKLSIDLSWHVNNTTFSAFTEAVSNTTSSIVSLVNNKTYFNN